MSSQKRIKSNEDFNLSPQLQKKNFSSSQKSNSSSSFIKINDQEENAHLCQEILNYFKQQQQIQQQNGEDNSNQQQSIIFFESQQHQKNNLPVKKNEKQIEDQENQILHLENPEQITKLLARQKKMKKLNNLDELFSETYSEKSRKSRKSKTNYRHSSTPKSKSKYRNNNLDFSIDSEEKISDIDSEKKFLEIFEKDPEIIKKKILKGQTKNLEFVNQYQSICDCCNFDDIELQTNANQNQSQTQNEKNENENLNQNEQNLQNQNKQEIEKNINLQNSQTLQKIEENQLVFFNFDQIWFQKIYSEINNINTTNHTSNINPLNYDKQWTDILESYNNNNKLILLKYSLDEQMLNDIKNYSNPIILGIQGSISEQIIPLIHKFKNLIGIIIYGTQRMQERLQQNGFFQKYKKISTFVENKEQCYFEMKDYYINFYKKRICKYKEIDTILGKHLPVSSYLLKAPLKLMQAHYLLNSKYQFVKGKNEFFILNNFSEIKEQNTESIKQILIELKQEILQNNIIFDLRILKQSYIDKISQQFIDCINYQDEQDIAQAFIRLYLNCKPYFRLINQIMDSLNEKIIQKAKIFIISLRLSIQTFIDIEDFWSQEQKQQQLNLLENSEGFIDARALASNIQDCQKVLNPTISIYFGDRFYKNKYLKEQFEVGEQIVFPNFIRAVKNEEIGKQLATNQCGQKMTLFQIQFKKSQFQKNNSNFGTRLKAMFNSENQRPKSIKQFGKLDYQKVLKEYIINCFQVFKIEEINQNFDNGFLLIRLSVL